jgi:hypothetical protein
MSWTTPCPPANTNASHFIPSSLFVKFRVRQKKAPEISTTGFTENEYFFRP